jgi:hypothetical protein
MPLSVPADGNRPTHTACGLAVHVHQVDTTWRDLMEAAHGNPGVLTLARDPEHLARLEEANQLLEDIQKGLAAYLEVKRLVSS